MTLFSVHLEQFYHLEIFTFLQEKFIVNKENGTKSPILFHMFWDIIWIGYEFQSVMLGWSMMDLMTP